MTSLPPSVSILLGCYGDYPHYSLRAVRALVNRHQTPLHVGCNACGAATIRELRAWRDAGQIDTLIECGENINKDPMLRLLLERARTDYIFWLDDDIFLTPGWEAALHEFLGAHAPFDVAGHVFYCGRSPEYDAFLRERPWWHGEHAYPHAGWRQNTWFATGGYFLARAAYLRTHDYPDRRMIKRLDDVLLGDMVVQTGGRLVDFSKTELMRRILVEQVPRRGCGESEDGWIRQNQPAA